jgi:hypothetical protein
MYTSEAMRWVQKSQVEIAAMGGYRSSSGPYHDGESRDEEEGT